MSYAQAVIEDARLRMLTHLRAENDYSAHEHALRAMLRDTYGITLSAERLRGELAWLDEQGLVVVVGEAVQVARLTQRGDDVATGAARVPGVLRPGPGV